MRIRGEGHPGSTRLGDGSLKSSHSSHATSHGLNHLPAHWQVNLLVHEHRAGEENVPARGHLTLPAIAIHTYIHSPLAMNEPTLKRLHT